MIHACKFQYTCMVHLSMICDKSRDLCDSKLGIRIVYNRTMCHGCIEPKFKHYIYTIAVSIGLRIILSYVHVFGGMIGGLEGRGEGTLCYTAIMLSTNYHRVCDIKHYNYYVIIYNWQKFHAKRC